MDQIVQIFKALGDETRLKILIILLRRRICAKGIARHLDISESAVSQHLKILKEAGIIIGEKRGYYVHYNIQESSYKKINEFLEDIMINESSIFGIQIPIDCRVECRMNKNRCCDSIKNRKENIR